MAISFKDKVAIVTGRSIGAVGSGSVPTSDH
jgi:hypothetical protein